MKGFASILGYFFGRRGGRHIRALLLYVLFLVLIIVGYSLLFQHYMLELEDRQYSFVSSLYWTITAMSTLGFGDITFHSDPGRIFSMVVTISGVFFLLTLLPFAAISLFFAPMIEKRLRYRPRLRVPDSMREHVILCGWDPVIQALAGSLTAAKRAWVTVEADYEQVVRLDAEGESTMYGVPTDADVLNRAGVERARAVVGNMSDADNINLALTVRSHWNTPMIAMVADPAHAELLQAAGADQTVALREILGGYLAVRATTVGTMSHVFDTFDELLFAEIPAHGTVFSGQTLAEADIRAKTGASVVGMWERGRFTLPRPDNRITDGMLLVLVGTREHLDNMGRALGETTQDDRVIVVGYGAVGKAAAGFLRANGVDHVLVDLPHVDTAGAESPFTKKVVHGDASRREVLEEAGIDEARGLIVTTNDDGINLFLTLACRRINPHIRIVARANRGENVAELYAAGADFVVSHTSVGASILTNIIEGRKNVFLTEGISVFLRAVPRSLAGASVSSSGIRAHTGATVIAILGPDSTPDLEIGPHTFLRGGSTLVMVGGPDSEKAFVGRYGA
jgi:voltage-gated potassium channel